ncbi:sigma-70 family RNA polymerase sigma factor [Winogradskyella sp. 3972H.M.0a.05]|uniref:RNA polymerase sigma factor n=1 Tax=Winogradskyella sp. 3972H.M.0a.05 TaxID=2950277 RepID=UPI0033930D70
MVDEQLIKGLKNGDSKALEIIYTRYRKDFISFASRYSISEDSIVDIYQNAIIALRDNAIKGKIENLKSELKTYLFSIGKYMIFEHSRKQQKVHLVEDVSYFDIKDINLSDLTLETSELTEEQKLLHNVFKNMGGKCKEILTLFYYRGLDLEEIMIKLNYNNKDVVKSQKSRCLKSLRSMMLNQ